MSKNICINNLIDIIKKNSIGKSLSYPSGWINSETIVKIAKLIENGKIDKFGKLQDQYDETIL